MNFSYLKYDNFFYEELIAWGTTLVAFIIFLMFNFWLDKIVFEFLFIQLLVYLFQSIIKIETITLRDIIMSVILEFFLQCDFHYGIQFDIINNIFM